MDTVRILVPIDRLSVLLTLDIPSANKTSLHAVPKSLCD